MVGVRGCMVGPRFIEGGRRLDSRTGTRRENTHDDFDDVQVGGHAGTDRRKYAGRRESAHVFRRHRVYKEDVKWRTHADPLRARSAGPPGCMHQEHCLYARNLELKPRRNAL